LHISHLQQGNDNRKKYFFQQIVLKQMAAPLRLWAMTALPFSRGRFRGGNEQAIQEDGARRRQARKLDRVGEIRYHKKHVRL
jgi:hypothetical protein